MFRLSIVSFFLLLISGTAACHTDTSMNATAPVDQLLKVSKGFKATIVLPQLGRNRHITVAPNGDLFVKLDRLKEGKGIVQLRKTPNGVYEPLTSFGSYAGTGIAIKNGFLYASSNQDVFRYPISEAGDVNWKDEQRIITGLRNERQHASKSLTLDNEGNIYVNIGAPSNACQVKDRMKDSPGQDPCPILETAGGIWKFSSHQLNQGYAQGKRYATGIRNVVGLDWNSNTNALYALQHGRDQLNNLYPELYDEVANAELPAEEFLKVTEGSDFGWPYCYYDHLQKKKVLAPEYGGNLKTEGRCLDKQQPILAFPGHWGPNALLFYTGNKYPERYKNGAFIAFHGSWNRAPLGQQGYFVVFVPFKNGIPTGEYEIFADGFAGTEKITSTGDAKHRPCGLALTPDGNLLISDSIEGRIWEIVYEQ